MVVVSMVKLAQRKRNIQAQLKNFSLRMLRDLSRGGEMETTYFVWSSSLRVRGLGLAPPSQTRFLGYLSHRTDLFTYLPPFNTTTLIKPMNEEEEEAPLEDSRIRRNRLARERHVARSKEWRAAYANRRVAQRAARSDAQIVVDANQRIVQRAAQIATNANWRAAQKAARKDAQIATNVKRRAAQKVARSDAQITADAKRRAAQRAMRNDVQIAMDAKRRAAQRTMRNDEQITADANWRAA